MTAIVLALSVDRIGDVVMNRWGYIVPSDNASHWRSAVLAAAAFEVLATAALAFYAWRKAADFEDAAARIDELVGARQELITLAGLANPSRPESKETRSPLFAVLWRHAIAYLDSFDPRRAFSLKPARAVTRSILLAIVTVAGALITVFFLMRTPTATQAAAYALRNFARSIDVSASSQAAHEMAEAARDVAKDLENPRVPPPQQLAELRAIQQQIQKYQNEQSASQQGSGSATGNGSGKGSGGGSGSGSGSGNGNGGEGKGAGSNSSASGSGSGSSGGEKSDKADARNIQLQKKLDKAEAKLEDSSQTQSKTQGANDQDKSAKGTIPQAGNSPSAGAGDNAEGTGNIKLPEPGKLAQNRSPSSSGNSAGVKNDNGTQGDTHLGDFPKPANYERYYKLGEQGPPVDIKNARYVTFRIPAAVVNKGGAGQLVRDNGAPVATAPYTNAPLKQENSPALPDEEQLMPPRYRDLIR
jgi:uncharacterized membrane protein YgcG